MSYGTISGGPVNYGIWSSLYPYSYLTNYGGQYQMNVMPSGIPAQEAYEIQNCLNLQLQLGRLLSRLDSIPYRMQPPYEVQAASQQAFLSGAASVMNFAIQVRIDTAAGKIGSLKNQIQAAIKNTSGLTDAQKQELETLLFNVEELENLLKQTKDDINAGATREEINERLKSINETYNELVVAASETAQKIKEELEEASSEEEENGKVSSEEEDPSSKKEDKTSAEELYNRKQWCHDLYDAVDGCGTDNEKLDEDVLSQVNEGNVLELIEQWNQSYASIYESSDPHGIIETIMDDSEGSEKEYRALVFINALEKRAILLGINVDSEVAAARTAIKGQHRWYHLWIGRTRRESEITPYVNALIKKVNDEEAKIKGKKVITNMEKYM